MNINVATTPMEIDGREFVFAEVIRGMGKLGTMRYIADSYTATDVFFMEDEPIYKIYDQKAADPSNDKLINQMWGAEKVSDMTKVRISSVAENFYRYGQGLVRSALPLLELLTPGLYVVHESQMHPTDGGGKFFWNAYINRRELAGSADHNNSIGDGNFTPSFLLPTIQAASFQPGKMYEAIEKIKEGKEIGGVAYHVTGMFSALLNGHHTAIACMINDVSFRCVVVEPLTSVIYDSKPGQTKNKEVIALSCPYINIPLDNLPEKTLERFLVTRRAVKPATFTDIKGKMGKAARAVSKKVFPMNVYEKATELPDCSLVESASIVNHLSEMQLEALLAGEVMFCDEYIIASNLFASIVAAANYLQISNFQRYIEFAIDILKNPDLSDVHMYICECLMSTMNPSVYEFFMQVAGGMTAEGGIIFDTAYKYTAKYEEYIQKKENSETNFSLSRKRKSDNMKAISEAKGIVSLEMAAKSIS